MKIKVKDSLALFCSCGSILLLGCLNQAGGCLEAAPARGAVSSVVAGQMDNWSAVWNAVRAGAGQLSRVTKQEGPPLQAGDYVLFRFRAPSDTQKIFLAGSFNNFAHNSNGTISNERFAMQPAGNDFFYKYAYVEPTTQKYKYVILTKDGKFRWVSDPQVKVTDADGNSVLDFSKLERLSTLASFSQVTTSIPAPSTVETPRPLIRQPAVSTNLEVSAEKVWVRPDQTNAVLVTLKEEATSGAKLSAAVLTPFGTQVATVSQAATSGLNRLVVPPLKIDGGFLVQVTLSKDGKALAAGQTVITSVQNIADDLRYGFYATFREAGSETGDYNRKAAMLVQLHINAVEFYDYFPAHGNYAPREVNYKFEPFGIPVNALDVQNKINSGHGRNVLSLAYVAAYAASASVYQKYPYPMRDETGVPKIFNGQVMTQNAADRQNKPKWFYLMDISTGSPWHSYILEEFGRTLDDSPQDMVSFDGFELDTYGDTATTKFYAEGSKRSGDLLSYVLRDFVREVRDKTRQIKPHGLVSFNSVNEFGVEKMWDVTDFGFLEIWNDYTKSLDDLVDICFQRRTALPSKRVVLKLYPADMLPKATTWPAAALRRVLGATMTGAGSLMVAGEPDEKSGRMHGLNSLFYPDHQPLSQEAKKTLRDYYEFDALLFGVTHGRGVENTTIENLIPGCIVRTYAVPGKKMLVAQMLNVADERQWHLNTPSSAPRPNLEIVLDLPAGIAPTSLLYASPDSASLQKPVELKFSVLNGKLYATLPELLGYGALILRY